MTWQAIGDGRRALRLPDPARAPQLLPVGSVMIESALSGDRPAALTLLELDRDTGWRHHLAVTLSPGGLITVAHRQGGCMSVASLQKPDLMADQILRLTWCWDAPARQGVLTAENITTGTLEQCAFDAPPPLPLEDAALLCGGENAAGLRCDPAVTLVAVSDEIEPVGPMPGLMAGSWVETASGGRAVERLRPGDLVVTAEHGLQPVRQVAAREVPALGQFRPMRLRAPFFGLRADLDVAPHHRVLIDGTDAEYLFGTDTVLVEAGHLRPMAEQVPARASPVVTYYQVVLDRHDCLHTAGTWSESLYLGQLARRPAQHACSVLSHVPPEDIPIHSDIAGPLLKPYEAMVLVSTLCA